MKFIILNMMNMDSPKESLHSYRTKETVQFRISFGNIKGNDFGGSFFENGTI